MCFASYDVARYITPSQEIEMPRYTQILFLATAFLSISASSLYAQASIAGTVKDTSNAVLPGVTVEAASPALIEKVRTVVTDGTGQYKIENLRPGTYSVTFSLAGFSTVKRDGVELTGTFTANINAEMRVGALEETITVTGETPVVDVQSTTRQMVLDRELIREIPSSRNPQILAGLLPGVTKGNADVGGLAGESSTAAGAMTVHGNGDVRSEIGGISIHATQGSGVTGLGNVGAYQELQVDTGAISAEQKEGGVRMNVIPRDGGNEFRGDFDGAFTNQSMQNSNYTQELKSRGLAVANALDQYYDLNPSFGGPVKRDRLWFFGSSRYLHTGDFAPIFFNKNAGDPTSWVYEPTTTQVTDSNTYKAGYGRLTWQATVKNKIGVSYDYAHQCECPRSQSASFSPEANLTNYAPVKPITLLMADWSAPLTNRVLFEAGFLKRDSLSSRPSTNIYFTHNPGAVPLSSVMEQSTGLTYRASATTLTASKNPTRILKVAMSYITGAHAFKVGFNLGSQSQDQKVFDSDSAMSFRFNNGIPNQLTLRATPYRTFIDELDHGAFVQDRWTLHRFTVTAGLRYDYFHVSFPVTPVGPAPFAPNRNIVFPETKGVTWNDLEPRTGFVYDLFGTGKTALKVSVNRYLPFYGAPNAGGTTTEAAFTSNLGPASRLINTTTRSWNDANRNFVPDCDITNPVANGECGAMSNPDFGSTRAGSSYDPDTLTGWNKRPNSNWQFSAGVQHELLPGVSLDVSYFRTLYTNLVVTDNRAVAPSDYDTFSITAPLDPRLPGGGGYVVSGLTDLKPAAFSRPADNYITYADNYGKSTNHWNGVDIVANARIRRGLLLQGGTSTGRTSTDDCEVNAKLPEVGITASTYCHQVSSWLTQVKFIGTYTVPKIDVLASATFQSLPGPGINANFTATNAIVAPSLGRNLSGGANVTVNLLQPNTMYGERLNQVDVRLGKVFSHGRLRATPSIDIYNILNANPVTQQNNAFASWQQPQRILTARFARLSLRMDF
jgi:hypothetical protein